MSTHEYKFRVVKEVWDGDVVYVVQCHSGYTYGETLSSYGWCSAYREYELEDYFEEYYETKEAAIAAVKNYRGEEEVVWQEEDEDGKDNVS